MASNSTDIKLDQEDPVPALAEWRDEEKLAMAKEILAYDFSDDSHLWEALQVRRTNVKTIEGRPVLRGFSELSRVGHAVVRDTLRQYAKKYLPYVQRDTVIDFMMTPKRLNSVCRARELHTCLSKGLPGKRYKRVGRVKNRTAKTFLLACIGAVVTDCVGNEHETRLVMENLGVLPTDEFKEVLTDPELSRKIEEREKAFEIAQAKTPARERLRRRQKRLRRRDREKALARGRQPAETEQLTAQDAQPDEPATFTRTLEIRPKPTSLLESVTNNEGWNSADQGFDEMDED